MFFQFATLCSELEETGETAERIDRLAQFFKTSQPDDAAWAIHLLRGEKLRRVFGPQSLRQLLIESVSLPEWLIAESIQQAHDLAEATSLLTSSRNSPSSDSLSSILTDLSSLTTASEKSAYVLSKWQVLSSEEAYQFNKLILGTFKSPVTRSELASALAIFTGLRQSTLSYRLSKEFESIEQAYREMLSPDVAIALDPHPFAVASPVNAEMVSVINRDEYLAEWMHRGFRAQLIKRNGILLLWSASGDLISDLFPEILSASELLPDGTTLDGQITLLNQGRVAPESDMQKRLAKRPSKSLLQSLPARFVAFDLLEMRGEDFRSRPLWNRREQLDLLLADLELNGRVVSSLLLDREAELRDYHQRSAKLGHRGLVLKHREHSYALEERPWFEWLHEPKHLLATLLHAERGDTGRFEMFTFGIRSGEELVPIAKLPLELSDQDRQELEAWIAKNMLEKFGPVRTLKAELVFEIEYETAEASTRRKAGVTLVGAKVTGWLRGRSLAEITDASQIIRIPSPAYNPKPM